MVSRNAMDPSLSSTVDLMRWLIELRWEWNSVRSSQAMQTRLSLRWLYHHLWGWGAVIKALSSTCSITKFVCRKCHQWRTCTVVVLKHKFEQIHDVFNRLICFFFRDGWISFKSVLSHPVFQNCWDNLWSLSMVSFNGLFHIYIPDIYKALSNPK